VNGWLTARLCCVDVDTEYGSVGIVTELNGAVVADEEVNTTPFNAALALRVTCVAAPPTLALNVKLFGVTWQFVSVPAIVPAAVHTPVSALNATPTVSVVASGVAHT
jgi:hypothetical protein